MEREWWQSLVHVCRRWRSLVFGSPRRLHLRLCCTNTTPVLDTLDVWPPFPFVILGSTRLTEDVNNVVAALERRDRVDEIHLYQVEKVLPAMQEPFPELTFLQLESYDKSVPVVPDSLLGGSAPLGGSAQSLRYLVLNGIPFPGLPKLLLSTTNLVVLDLSNIPHSGYISPDTLVTALSTLISLGSLSLHFQSPRSYLDQANRHLHPLTRTVLPALTRFFFKGVHEYLDDLVAGIDAPQLINLELAFFNDIVFDAPQLIQFINRTPTLSAVDKTHVAIGHDRGIVNSLSQTSRYKVVVLCSELDWQLSSLEQVCTSCLPPLSTTEDLYIYQDPYLQAHWKDNTENLLWPELLHPFTTVKNLYLSKEFMRRIMPALQDLDGGRTTEVLPTLQNIFLEEVEPGGRVQEDIGRFVAARQLSGHTITVSHWERDPIREWIWLLLGR